MVTITNNSESKVTIWERESESRGYTMQPGEILRVQISKPELIENLEELISNPDILIRENVKE